MSGLKKQKQRDAFVQRMIELAENGYNCSQIVMSLALEQEDQQNPDLIRAMSGLGDGCGFFNETCGILTGSACRLSWYAGKGSDREKASEKYLPMLQDLGEWFEEQVGGKYNSTRCRDIVGDKVGTQEGMHTCGRLLLMTHVRTNEILASYGFIAD